MASQPFVVKSDHIDPGVSLQLYSDRVLHMVIDDGVVLDLESVRTARQRIAGFVNGPYIGVGDLRQVPYIERDARAELALDNDGRVVATAAITGRDGPIPLLVKLWVEGHDIARPVAVFEDVPEALAWAHETALTLRNEGRLP